MTRTPGRTAAALAAAVAVAVAVVPGLAGCGGGGDGTPSGPTAAASPAAPSPQPTPTAAEPTPGAPADTETVAVYWVMDTTGGPRLYREFTRRPNSGQPVVDALEAMFEGDPADADYDSLWPGSTRVLAVQVDGGTATVDLSAEALDGQGGSAFEQASVQQLVHTVTAVDTSVQQVQVLVEGERPDSLWGSVSLREPVSRAPAVEVLGPVWLLTPTEGGTLARGEAFGGVATVFEATVSWRWLQDGEAVAEGFSTATEGGPGRGDWTAEVDVPPGDYVLEAFEASADDGSRLFTDSKTVTVTS